MWYKRTARVWFVIACIVATIACPGATAADLEDARQLFYEGDYEGCEALARTELQSGARYADWPQLIMRCLLERGEYDAAADTFTELGPQFPTSLPLRMLGAEALRYSGQTEKARTVMDEFPVLFQAAPYRFSDADNRIAIGRLLIEDGEDARTVLDGFYDRVLKSDPDNADAHLAIAQLALSKNDYQEAVKSLEKCDQLRPTDPYPKYLLARAWSASDAEKAANYLDSALQINPRHSECLLLQAEELIDGERYTDATTKLREVLNLNAKHPTALALLAAIAHLEGRYEDEGEYRRKALESWDLNPNVDSKIGTVLSRHYRFQEGIEYQRRALKLQSDFRPALFQLAQDLLRVGRPDEGWNLVNAVAKADQYNVVAFNLRTLGQRLQEFETIETPSFIVRMSSKESVIYGPDVVRLLTDAKDVLCEKYRIELKEPVHVEIFPNQSDFAIRTFGLPGGAGYLGVCFGNLITANSPASQGASPANWESVLWHEFCHVITLNKTMNRMPRWLSEGISVYEEVERDVSWGQHMNPQYLKMLQSEDFVPLSKLSSAFMSPKTPQHLDFAYFESSLAVRYLIERHGMPSLLRLLDDLGAGLPMERAMADRFGDQAKLDADFRNFIDELCHKFTANGFSEEEYLVAVMEVQSAIGSKSWEEAMAACERLLKLYPADIEAQRALAAIGKATNNVEMELSALDAINQRSSNDLPAITRSLELLVQLERWDKLLIVSQRMIAVNPLIPIGHENLLLAASKLSATEASPVDIDRVARLRALQQLEPTDPAKVHFDLALAYHASSETDAARREVLCALELAPRYREALALLLELQPQEAGDDTTAVENRVDQLQDAESDTSRSTRSLSENTATGESQNDRNSEISNGALSNE